MLNSYQIIQKSDELQSEAEQIINELELIPLLSNYGKPEIIGSLALHLLTRRDADIYVIVEEFNKKAINDLVKHLLDKSLPRIDFTFIDNTNKLNNNLPEGYYVGIEYAGKKELIEKFKNNPDVWQIDIWFLTQENAQGSRVTNEIKEKLTPEKRETILKIKFELSDHMDYKRKFSGIDIYKAVLDNNVLTSEEFLNNLYSGTNCDPS